MPDVLGSLVVPKQSAAPSSPVTGQVYYDTDDNILYLWNGTAWKQLLPSVIDVANTFAVLGDLAAVTQLPSFWIPKGAGQGTINLVGVRHKIGSGTSVALQLKRNGSNLGSAITVTTTATTTAIGPQAISDMDEITATLASHTGTPTTLSATVLLEWTP